MKFGSVCSGVEAASVAWHPLGWEAQFLSEIEPFPSAVLAHHYPSVPNLDDMTKFKEWNHYDIDVLVGGTPCQSFSVAGLRKGLADPRGNLMLTYLAIADRYRPKWLVWENVPGVLSSNAGQDFGTFLGGLAELGYGFAYRVLDAQYFGVAQRRRRVFVVACLGDWRAAAAVLFERHSLSGNPAPSRQAGQDIAGTISSRTTGGGGLGTDFELGGGLQPISYALQHAQVGRKDSAGPQGKGWQEEVAFTQDSRSCADIVATMCMATGQAGAEIGAEISPTLNCNHESPIVFDTTQISSPTNRSNPQPGDACHTLAKGSHAPTIAFNLRGREHGAQLEIDADGLCNIRAASGGSSRTMVATAFDCKASGMSGFGVGEVASTMRAMGHAGSHQNGGGHLAAQIGMQVRRLTPRECERLQGFPDDYTLVTVRKKPAADGPRYKAMGNSMAVPVMHWIGKRIAEVEALT